MKIVHPLLAVALVMLCPVATADDDPEAWLEADDDSRALSVNEGVLTFLRETPGRRVLQTSNRLTITPGSLRTGWVELYQCQSNLDPVPDVEVVYRYRGMRGLRVVSTRAIGRARVENNSVQMTDVQKGGEVCIEAEVQVLKKSGAGQYQLTSGPFHRRFLDGYYPVRLEYRIHWPAGRLQLETVYPEPQAGFSVHVQPGELTVDTLFEGMLTIHSRWRVLR